MARKLKIASEWYRKELAAHKRTMAKPMRPQSYRPNVDAKAVEYALWLLERDGIDLDALGAEIREEWNEGAKPVNSYRAIRGAHTRARIAPDCPILPHVEWAPCAAGLRPWRVHWTFGLNSHTRPRYVYSLELPNWSFVAEAPAEQLELAA